jgi:Ca2+-binding RTX toxin-like protein
MDVWRETLLSRSRVCAIAMTLAFFSFLGLSLRPEAARGSTASVVAGVLTYAADTGEANDVTVSDNGLFKRITDTGATITPGLGCLPILSNVVDCSAVLSAVVNAGDGADTVAVTVPLVSTLNGGDGNDALTAGSGIDVLNGGNDGDVLDGGTNADVLNGGAGLDTASYAGRAGNVTADIDGLADDGEALELDTIASDVENLMGGDGDDVLTGDANGNTLTGSSGADTLDGGTGGDTLSGGADVDTVTYASRSNDVTVSLDNANDDGEAGENDDVRSDVQNVIAGTGNDTLTGSIGNNTLSGGDGADTLDGGLGADVLDGAAGSDWVSYASHANDVVADLDGLADDGQLGEGDQVANVENLVGGSGNDSLTGDSGPNTLTGLDGNDILDGIAGADVLTGGAGDDTIEGGDGLDSLNGGAGADTLRSRDPFADQVVCGSEPDSVLSDLLDVIGADCEQIDNGLIGGGTGGGGGGGTIDGGTGGVTAPPPAGAGTVVIPATRLTVNRTGTLAVLANCTGSGPCVGTVKVETARRVRLSRKRKARKLSLGSYPLNLPAGGTAKIKLKLPAKLLKLLGRKKIELRVTAVTRDAAGGQVTVTRKIRIKAAKRR